MQEDQDSMIFRAKECASPRDISKKFACDHLGNSLPAISAVVIFGLGVTKLASPPHFSSRLMASQCVQNRLQFSLRNTRM
jgi:hypothetical protein